MKLDLIEINKLCPPGLWDVRGLSAFITCLVQVMSSGAQTRLNQAQFVYGPMVLRFSRELREKVQENLNMRIKAWVLQCPKRSAWVRHIIGETVIRKWRINRLLDYALSKYFGDWQPKFSDGFARKGKQIKNSPRLFIRDVRTYKWKPFALVKIVNVTGFLYGKTASNTEREDERAAHLKLWAVDVMDAKDVPKWQQPRAPRTMKPVEFTPYELELEENGDVAESATEEEVRPTARIIFNPTEKIELRTSKKAIKKPP